MAYKRNYKKKRYTKKAAPGRWQVYGAAAAQAGKDLMYLKSVINVEKKFTDIQANYNQGTTPTVINLTAISQGDSSSQRNGNSVKASSLMFRAFCKVNTAATQPSTFRILIVEDTQNIGSAPAFSDVIAGGGIISPLEKQNVPRFKVYCDKIYRLTIGASANSLQEFKCYKKLFHHIRFSGALGTDTRQGQIYLMTVCDDGTNSAAFRYYSRVQYIDN